MLGAQVTTLVSLGLLARESAASELDNVRLKCTVSSETIGLVAASVKVEFRKFLQHPEAHALG
jgi:hypothetical protein